MESLANQTKYLEHRFDDRFFLTLLIFAVAVVIIVNLVCGMGMANPFLWFARTNNRARETSPAQILQYIYLCIRHRQYFMTKQISVRRIFFFVLSAPSPSVSSSYRFIPDVVSIIERSQAHLTLHFCSIGTTSGRTMEFVLQFICADVCLKRERERERRTEEERDRDVHSCLSDFRGQKMHTPTHLICTVCPSVQLQLSTHK